VALALVAIVVGVTYYLMDLEKEKEKEEMRAELQSEINFSQEGLEQEEEGEGAEPQSPAHALRSETHAPGVKNGRRVSSEKFDVKPPAVVMTQTTTVKTTSTITSAAAAKKQAVIMDRSDCEPVILTCLVSNYLYCFCIVAMFQRVAIFHSAIFSYYL